MALALVDEDERFVSCCLRLLGLFGASLAISLDIPGITHTQQKLHSTREKPREKWRSKFESVIEYLSEHPVLYFLAFDWLTDLNGQGNRGKRRAKVSLRHKETMKTLFFCGRYMQKENKLDCAG